MKRRIMLVIMVLLLAQAPAWFGAKASFQFPGKICSQNADTGDKISFVLNNGFYLFEGCDGQTLSGVGTIAFLDDLVILTHLTADRSIYIAVVDTGRSKGFVHTATIDSDPWDENAFDDCVDCP